MSGRDVIADTLPARAADPELWADVIIRKLAAAGYTIIRDDENHKATVERCAKEADDLSRDELFLDAAGRFGAELAAASIRSLIKEDGE